MQCHEPDTNPRISKSKRSHLHSNAEKSSYIIEANELQELRGKIDQDRILENLICH